MYVFEKKILPLCLTTVSDVFERIIKMNQKTIDTALKRIRIGIDVGSTTAKMVVLDESTNEQLFSSYERHQAKPQQTIKSQLEQVYEITGDCEAVIHITGSVGMGFAELWQFPFIQEVVAASKAIQRFHPQVRTMIDIGGEDAKVVFFTDGKATDLRMNGNCAGGTGAFIDQTATLLGVETSELNALAEQAEHIYPIASRCGVFSKTDIQNLISRSVSKADIAASMLHAVCMQVVSALARGTEVLPKVFLCGGPFAYIPALGKHMRQAMGIREEDIVIPKHTQFIPAIGTALLAVKEMRIDVPPDGRLSALRAILDSRLSIIEGNNVSTALPPFFHDEAEYGEWLKGKVKSAPEGLKLKVESAPEGLKLKV